MRGAHALGDLAGLRDRALLLLGFAAALRRSELVALDACDLDFDPARGCCSRSAGSKTDQEQEGATVAVPYTRASNRSTVRARRYPEAAAIHRARCSARCAAATHSPSGGSQTTARRRRAASRRTLAWLSGGRCRAAGGWPSRRCVVDVDVAGGRAGAVKSVDLVVGVLIGGRDARVADQHSVENIGRQRIPS